MIRVLIVDDEPIERIALQKIITEGLAEVEVVGQASNGREAIEQAERLLPDLITMDIKMPGLSGLEAIQGIKAAGIRTKFIMVTAFDTFEFARQALQLGVSDYLLKPSKKAVILETIGKVVEDILAERKEQERQRLESEKLRKMLPIVEADIVSQLLFDDVQSVHLSENIELLGVPGSRGGFVVNLLLSEPKKSEGSHGDLEKLYDTIIAQLNEASIHYWIGKLSGKQVPIIVFISGELSYRNNAVGIGQKLVQLVHRNSDYEPFAGIGGLCIDIGGAMRKSYHEALLASVDLNVPARFRLYEDLPHHEGAAARIETLELEKNVLEEVRRGSWEAASDQALQMIDAYEGAGEQIGMAQQRIFEVLIIVTRMLHEMGVGVDKPYYPNQAASFVQLKGDTRGIFNRLAGAAAALEGEMESDLLLTLKRYIREHAHEDLSLERIAAHVDRNPFYVSKLFKEYFGMNYIDYLTECRVETAKQLMQDPDKSLKEITFEIGYNDPNYFSRVFRKIVGSTPTDYRKQLLRPAVKKQS
ncbi:two-component system response regulator YesN [Paenibacillus taihuensis]|uniref:Two-component system response regulator YesN n=1 Tax=Paenibacillus taihuensis TaxID=1156355 RepID=A0A3D9SBL9_9BACL|nr:response regulator [Paenibacillus taihuensis]REE88506.1 two-component system response regulator YesN [Paenibacillus taihuensis]